MLRLVAVTAFTVVTVSAASRCCDALNAVEETLRSKVRIAGSTPAVTTFFCCKIFPPNERNVALIRLIGSGRSQAE